jgi:hypothetical protein
VSIQTLSRKVRELTPEDELIGSLTKERVNLMVRYAGAYAMDNGEAAGRHWLAYALETDIPEHDFSQLYHSFIQARETETVCLEFWYGVANTTENREQLQRGADMTIDHCVILLANRLSTQLGVAL